MTDSLETRMFKLFHILVRTIGAIQVSVDRSSQIRALLAGLILAGCASPNPAPEVTRLVPPREDCTVSEAVPAALEDFISHPNRFIDKCIHVRGFVAFRDVVPNLQWLYEHPKPDERVAIYGKSPPDSKLWTMRKYADLVGFAYSCEQLGTFAVAQAEQENEEAKKKGSNVESIPFISGNCHYRGGPVLWVSLISVDENSPNRLFGPAAANYGSLTPMLSSAPHAIEIANAIGPIFEFVRKQDKAGLEAHLAKIGDGGAPSHANDAVDTNQSPFSFLLGAPKASDVHYFVPKERIRGAAGNYASIGCVCKIDDCSGKWPIAELDAGNEPQWPYSCIRTMKEDNNMFVYLY